MGSFLSGSGKWRILVLLLATGPVVGWAGEDDFLRAVRDDLRSAAAHLLDAGAKPEVADSDGTTALMWAARHGNRSLVEALLAQGAEPRRARPDGYSLIMAAAESGDTELFDLIIRRVGFGAPITEEGYTLLMAAARGGNVDLFNRVRQRDGDFDRRTREGYSLLMAAAEGGQPAIFAEVRKRLDQSRDLLARPATGETLLHYAAVGGSPEIADQLLKAGLAVVLDARNLAGETPLLVAAREGHASVARLLVEKKADLTIPDLKGKTPLHYAAQSGHRPMTAVLLAGGADANMPDDEGRTSIHEVLDFFRTCGFARPYDRIEQRRLVDAEETLRLLLVRGGDPNIADRAGETAAHVIAGTRFPELVPMLRAAGARYDVASKEGHSPLDLAREANYPPMIRALETETAAADDE